MFEKINQWFLQGLWGENQVNQAAQNGVITAAEAETILQKKGENHA